MPAPVLPHSPAVLFESATGKLYWREDRHLTVLLPWPHVRAYRARDGGESWRLCSIPLVIPPPDGSGREGRRPQASDRPARALQRYLARIPETVRAAILPFPSHHWELLVWASAAGPAGEDLCRSNPALAFILALAPLFDPRAADAKPTATPPLIAYRRQEVILGRFGFPRSERARRILAKIIPGAVAVEPLLGLRTSIRRQAVAARLAHAPRINANVLALAGGPELAHLATAAVMVLGSAEYDDPTTRQAKLLAEILEWWPLARPTAAPPAIRTVERIAELHDALEADLVRVGYLHPEEPDEHDHVPGGRTPWEARQVVMAPNDEPAPAARPGQAAPRERVVIPDRPFPPHPVPGNNIIVPLTSSYMLLEEGLAQHNCVASYANRAARGTVAIYKVLHPQRCTLSLGRHKDGWRVDQLRGTCNAAASDVTRRVVLAWLREAAGQTRISFSEE